MNRLALLRIVLALGLSLSALAGARAADPVILVVMSERSASYLEAAEAMTTELEKSGVSRTDIQVVTATEVSPSAAAPPKLVVTVGSQAASVMSARDSRVPLLATLLPRSAFEQISQSTGRKPTALLSAIYINQPFGRQLDLIRLALPDARRVGVLWGVDALGQVGALQTAALERNLQVMAARVAPGESVFPLLQKVLEDSDVFLSVPDPQIFNSASIQNILLTSFRLRVPFVGFSPSYVQAGAVFSVHSTPAMIGRQAAALARNVLQGRGLPTSPVNPIEFAVTVNEQVARSLGLSLSATSLQERLRQMERAP